MRGRRDVFVGLGAAELVVCEPGNECVWLARAQARRMVPYPARPSQLGASASDAPYPRKTPDAVDRGVGPRARRNLHHGLSFIPEAGSIPGFASSWIRRGSGVKRWIPAEFGLVDVRSIRDGANEPAGRGRVPRWAFVPQQIGRAFRAVGHARQRAAGRERPFMGRHRTAGDRSRPGSGR